MKRLLFSLLLICISINSFSQNDENIKSNTLNLKDSFYVYNFIRNTEAVYLYNDYYGNYLFISSTFKKEIKNLWVTFYIFDKEQNIYRNITCKFSNIKHGLYFEWNPYSDLLKENIIDDVSPYQMAKVQWKNGKYKTINLLFIKKEFLWTLQ